MADTWDANVVVIGAGAAGLTAACAAAPRAETVLVTDRALGACNSAMAQGGLQVPLPDAGARRRFEEDVIRSARVPVDATLVRGFVDGVVDAVDELERWGLVLDRDERGELVRRRAGGLSDARIVSAGDAIGPALMRVLQERVAAAGVDVRTHTRIERVGVCDGGFRLELREPDGAGSVLRARVVVAATGGVTYRVARDRGEPTTNPRNDNHILYEALCGLGIERVHEQYFQYQPFGIVSFDTGSVARCVPESIVNLPVRLVDRRGDVVCDLTLDRLAVGEAMQRALRSGDGWTSTTGRSGLRLTLSEIPAELLAAQFPRLAALLDRHGALGDDVLVRPLLHYQLGGFHVALDGRTAIPGLFLAGEMTGGLHGRNRLMGNGITDALVRGRLAGRAAATT